MKLLRTVFVAGILGLGAPVLLAHPGHGKEISAETATRRAGAEVDRLVEEGKIEKSWALGRIDVEAIRRGADDDEQWLVTFDNPAAADAGKRRLYVFLTLSGDYIAANFSGK